MKKGGRDGGRCWHNVTYVFDTTNTGWLLPAGSVHHPHERHSELHVRAIARQRGCGGGIQGDASQLMKCGTSPWRVAPGLHVLLILLRRRLGCEMMGGRARWGRRIGSG